MVCKIIIHLILKSFHIHTKNRFFSSHICLSHRNKKSFAIAAGKIDKLTDHTDTTSAILLNLKIGLTQ